MYLQAQLFGEQTSDSLVNQIDSKLFELGYGEADWTEKVQDRFAFWLHIHVLQDTINVISDSRGGAVLKREAAEWLFSDKDGVLSFNQVCSVIGAKPKELLESLLERPEIKRGLACITQ